MKAKILCYIIHHIFYVLKFENSLHTQEGE